MRILLVCVGRLGERPEALLARDYAKRAAAAGRSLRLAPVDVIEVEPRKPGKTEEGRALLARAGEAKLIACDGRGQAMASADIAAALARWRDAGAREMAFLVGGSDGLSEELLGKATARLSFGPQTWPHALARVMLAEQIYRAITILAGSPYHRPA